MCAASRPQPHARPDRRTKLFRGAVAVCLAGLVAALIGPGLRAAFIAHRAETLAATLRQTDRALQNYVRAKGDWPAGPTPPGQLPAGLEEFLPPAAWSATTAIGGLLRWEGPRRHDGQKWPAVVALVPTPDSPVSSSRAQLTAIDRRLDDGNLATGRFRLGFEGTPIFIVEP